MKVTDKIREQAATLAQKHGFKQIWVNEKGEFFSDRSFAANSVGGDKNQYAEVKLGVVTKSVGTNDLGKAADVITAIEVSTDVDEVRAILDAEVAGKDRKSVVEAASKKIAAFATKQQDASGAEGGTDSIGGEDGDDLTGGDSSDKTTTESLKNAEK